MEKTKGKVDLVFGGAGQGTQMRVEELLDRRTSLDELPQITVVDPVPGKAIALVEKAQRAGLPMVAVEQKMQDFLRQNGSPGHLGMHTDSAKDDAEVLESHCSATISGSLFLGFPTGEVYAAKWMLPPKDKGGRNALAVFLRGAHSVTSRKGSYFLFGTLGRPEHRALQPVLRDWLKMCFERDSPKLEAGLEPESAPVTISSDGQTEMAVIFKDNRAGWQNPVEMAREAVANPPLPLLRGENFAVAETGPDGVRLHLVRLRKLDGKPSLRGSAALDEASVERLLRKAVRKAATATAALLITD